MGMRTVGLGLVVGIALPACPGPYSCSSDDQCRLDGAVGVCMFRDGNGYCVYPSGSCESGQRFSTHARRSLADKCVGVSQPDLGDDEDSSGSSSSSSSTTDDEPPYCGDGTIDPNEDCDDGNDEPGDGCTPQCRISGTQLWVTRYAGEPGFDDRATAMAIRGDGMLVVAGEQGEPDDVRSGLVLALDDQGDLLTDPWVDAEPSDRSVHGVAARDLDVMVAGEQGSAGPAGSRAWYAIVDMELEAQVLGAIDTLAPETARGVGHGSRGFVLVGSQDDRGWATWVEASTPDWTGERLESLSAVATRADGAFMVVGPDLSGTEHFWLVSSQGVVLAEEDVSAQTIEAAGFDWSGRPVFGGELDGQVWLSTHDLDGRLVWGMSLEQESSSGTIEAIAPAWPAGSVVVGVDESGEQGFTARIGSISRVGWWEAESFVGRRLHAVVHSEDAVYVAGSEPNDEGDRDIVIIAMEP